MQLLVDGLGVDGNEFLTCEYEDGLKFFEKITCVGPGAQ